MIARASDLAATARPLPLERRHDIDAASLIVRGQRWWRLKDPVTLQFWQFGDEEHFLWSQLEAGVSLAELQQRFIRRFAPRRIELPHLHQFLGALHREGLVFSTAAGQGEILLDRHNQKRSRRRWQWLTNLLAIRFRGLDPTGLLEWIYPRAAWLFAPWSLVAFGLLVLSAVLLAGSEAAQIVARLPHAVEFLTPTNLVWLAATLAAIKVCHELGHALTCRHLGGRCHELGIMLLIFTPCLYCNVSDAWLMPSRWRRMAIGAAGICVELTLAAGATWLWWFSEPGLFSTLCLNVMVICSVNTLLFNGNPLLRFDGYFLLSDFLDLPNLRQASDEWLRDWLGRVLFGVEPSADPSTTSTSPYVLRVYAFASTAYRLFLTVFVWWMVYQWLAELRLTIVGAALVLLSAVAIIGHSTWSGWKMWSTAWQDRRVRSGRAAISLTAAVALLGVIGFVPWPRSVTAPAVLRPADATTIYVPLPGTLIGSVTPGTRVKSGDTLARLRNEELEQDLLRLSSERDVLRRQLESLTRQQVHDSRSGVASVAGQLGTVEQQLADVSGRHKQKLVDQEQLTLRATCSGVVLAPRSMRSAAQGNELREWQGTPLDAKNVGCYLEAGDVLCQIGEPDRREAIVVVEQSDIDFVREGQAVSVQLDELPHANLLGTVRLIAELSTAAAPAELAAKRLLPMSRESGEPQLLGTHYQVTVALDAGPPVPLGASGWGKVRVAPQTVAGRVYGTLCRTFRW